MQPREGNGNQCGTVKKLAEGLLMRSLLHALRVAPAGGTQVAAGTSSATVAVPNSSGGQKAKHVRVAVAGPSGGIAYVLPVQSGDSVSPTTGTR